MEYSINYLVEQNIIEIQCSGEAVLQGFKDYTKDLANFEYLGSKARFLFDHRKLNHENLTLNMVKEIAKYLRTYSKKMKNFKQAIVVSPEANLGKTRLFQILIDDLSQKGLLKTRIFTDYDRASQWLCSQIYIEL